MKTHLRFLNGLTTIGGNIIEITTETSRVITDFGTVTNDMPDISSAILHHDLPNVPDLFGLDSTFYPHQAIFISHLHIDHIGGLQYLAQKTKIPIYMSPNAYTLYQGLIAEKMEPAVTELHPLAPDTPLNIGDITVTGWLSDHDTLDPYAYLVQTPDYQLIHSGDVRLHGPHDQRVRQWAQKAHDLKPDLLLLEGTTFSFESSQPQIQATDKHEHSYIEQDLPIAILNELHNPAPTVINLYPRNIERLANLNKALLAVNATLIWEPAFARLLLRFYPTMPLTMWAVEPSDVELASETVVCLTPETAFQQLKQDPTHFILQNSFAHLDMITGLSGARYLHSNGEPLGDYDPRFQVLLDFLKNHQFDLIPFSASGHARREDLLTLAKLIQPKLIVPWHSFKPERMAEALKENGLETWLPQRDQVYLVGSKQ